MCGPRVPSKAAFTEMPGPYNIAPQYFAKPVANPAELCYNKNTFVYGK